MGNSPYQNLSPASFWSLANAKSSTLLPDGLYKKKWQIGKDEKIATAGSYFTQHVGRYLKRNGFHVLDMEPLPWGSRLKITGSGLLCHE